MQPSKLSALSSQSPFAQMAQQDQKKPQAAGQPKKPGILGRLCACGRGPEAQADEDPSVGGQPLEEKSRSNSVGSNVGRVMPSFSVAQSQKNAISSAGMVMSPSTYASMAGGAEVAQGCAQSTSVSDASHAPAEVQHRPRGHRAHERQPHQRHRGRHPVSRRPRGRRRRAQPAPHHLQVRRRRMAPHTLHDTELQGLPILQNLGRVIAAWRSTQSMTGSAKDRLSCNGLVERKRSEPCKVLRIPEDSCARRRINKHQEMDDLGATGLRSQDSLGITRARLAKQRLNESTALLDDIKNMEVSAYVGYLQSFSVRAAMLAGLLSSYVS